jgi:hypothetical protein
MATSACIATMVGERGARCLTVEWRSRADPVQEIDG